MNGKYHRIDGPAICDNNKNQYCIDGIEVDKEIFKEAVQLYKQNPDDFVNVLDKKYDRKF